jgi:choline-sulfatase
LNGSYLPFGAYDADMTGTWLAGLASDYIEDHTATPFLLFVGFTEPHSPFHFPIEYQGMYDPKQFSVPQPGPEDDWQIPEIFRELTQEEKQKIIAAGYTSTAFLDKNVGTVLQALEKHGLDENTVVIYLGDNGYHLGHHGRFEKHCLYEQAVRVPLLIRNPHAARNGQTYDKQVELIDLFPTVTEICGATTPPTVQGHSLLPALKGTAEVGREMVFSEYIENEEAMIRTKQYKFIYSSGKRLREDGYKTGKPLPGRTRILFDHLNDPQETTNLAGRSEYQEVIQEMEAELLLRFEQTYPVNAAEISSVQNVEDRLDWYLKPRDKKE